MGKSRGGEVPHRDVVNIRYAVRHLVDNIDDVRAEKISDQLFVVINCSPTREDEVLREVQNGAKSTLPIAIRIKGGLRGRRIIVDDFQPWWPD